MNQYSKEFVEAVKGGGYLATALRLRTSFSGGCG